MASKFKFLWHKAQWPSDSGFIFFHTSADVSEQNTRRDILPRLNFFSKLTLGLTEFEENVQYNNLHATTVSETLALKILHLQRKVSSWSSCTDEREALDLRDQTAERTKD